MKNKVNVNNNSIDSAGITKDYMDAVAELIWNGFDASASIIDIKFNSNEIDHINELNIVDNGTGINLAELTDTFGSFLDSVKRGSFQRSSYIRGKKGKGRFSFIAFANTAVWSTVFLDMESEKCLAYDVTIHANDKDHYNDDNKRIAETSQTGTWLKLSDLHGVTAYSFQCDEFINFLKYEFGWFLLLNSKNNFILSINGVPLKYDDILGDHEVSDRIISDAKIVDHKFTITYVRWNEKIGDKFYYYFLNGEKKEKFKQLTSFNNNAINFFHSIYIESDFFDDFTFSDSEESEPLFGNTPNNPVFKTLVKELQQIINLKQKEFVRINGANELISKYERNGVFPKFKNNKYEQEKRKDLVEVVREIYCIQPKIFKGLNETQEKTSIGFINLLLDTDERENILSILEGIVNISSEERENLSVLLKKTGFAHITRTINLIENRFKTVELLKTLVFDLKHFSNERDHIQHAIADNYWLFGEQFHLVTANEGFEKLLSNYLHLVDGLTKPPKVKIQDEEKNRRPDLFMCRQRSVPDPNNHDDDIEENIMVELKRPTVTIGKEQLRQIEDYMDFITRLDQFNSQTRKWKFFVVSNKVDEYIEKQYDEFKGKGKRYLVKSWGNLEVFAMTWDDVFRNFIVKHKYLLDKLDFDQKALHEELNLKGIKLDVSGAQLITNTVRIRALQNN
ncbi:MAG: ATP-binding protein [Candidatus Pedobacter colombiensis]|uniref:ATP-binding protein n=1 Tax=Candidatus Pedobacter colombiensis TaxID=3121371 RepID=A0AAJ5W633_9SPHI|nr:ATP-binding protein [Pedobacter sp.]WEK18667.1 MAG: ATP-binding protein [Pedobacter sp.]